MLAAHYIQDVMTVKSGNYQVFIRDISEGSCQSALGRIACCFMTYTICVTLPHKVAFVRLRSLCYLQSFCVRFSSRSEENRTQLKRTVLGKCTLHGGCAGR